MYRHLTPLGKICIVKSLALSKLSHLALVIPSLTQQRLKQLNSTLFKFIWNGKPDKVSRKDIIKPVSKGGLGMVQVDVFWKALKFSWFRRLATSNDIWPQILLSELAQENVTSTSQILFAGPSELKSWANRIRNPFWKEVLNIGAETITEASYAKPEQFSLFPICSNPLFKIGNRTISPERFDNSNQPILQVADLLHPETNTLFSRDGFCQRFNCNIPLRSYNAITNSIERAITKLNINWGIIETHPSPRQSLITAISCRARKGCSPYYKLLMCRTIESRDTRKEESKWHEQLGTVLSVPFWNSCHFFTNNIKNDNVIKYFQYQIVRGNLKTNDVVSKFIPLVNETCSFGCQTRETISDLFWSCPLIQNFWDELKHFLLTKASVPVNFTRLSVLFGNHDEKVDSVNNTILLVAKRFIWCQKFRPLRPTLRNFIKYFVEYLETLKMVNVIKNSSDKFHDLWGNIIVIMRDYLAENEPPPADPPPPPPVLRDGQHAA